MDSYAQGTSAVPLLGETISQNLRRTAEAFGSRDALIVRHQGYQATYAEFWQQVQECARGLLALGIAKGDRVGMWAPNRYEWVIVQYATAQIGAILVNINPAYRANELEYALNQSGCRFVIHSRGFRKANYTDMLAEVRSRCPELERTIELESSWRELLAGGAAITEAELLEREASLQFDDPINIQYTSGTTGFPKGATLSHHNILNNGFFTGEGLNLTERDRVLIPVPFYHCFGMVLGNLACTSHGACMVIPGEALDPAAVMKTVQDERCTAIYGTPTHFISELNHPDFADHDFSSLRTGIMAGAPCPVEVMKSVLDKMHVPEITICYGMTETSPVSTQTKIGDPFEKQVGTVGRVHPHVEIKVVDPETGRIVPRGVSGELCTRGYSVMLGYWNNADATTLAIDAAHWMHTGDLAVMDEDGYCNIVGRIKDMIIRGGENVYPREVEEFLYRHPAVADISVIGVPSEKYGEEIVAWVKLRDGATCTEQDLTDFCRGQIATFKIPRFWKFTDSFPMTVTGKIRKVEMREISVQELGLQQAALVKTA
ncbi:MAG TPA: AMP-binding protein [Candidatus Limnocylindria bacterium]